MQLTTILNRVERNKSFVYGTPRWGGNVLRPTLAVPIRLRANGRPVCSGCGKRRPGYDHLATRRFEYVPLWQIAVVFVYALRRVGCPRCWSDEFDRARNQISATLGMLIAMPTVVLIALVDGLTPANFNVSVLYTVPLVTCAWVRSERLLWTMFALVQVLAFGGLSWGPPSAVKITANGPLQNRILTAVMMTVVAGLLDYWIRVTRQIGNRDNPPEADMPDKNDEQIAVH